MNKPAPRLLGTTAFALVAVPIPFTMLTFCLAQSCASSSQEPSRNTGSDGGASTGSSSGSASTGAPSGNSGSAAGTGSSSTGSSGAPSSGTFAPTDSGVVVDSAAAVDGSSSRGCSGLPLCDDFESDTIGSPPDSSLWTLIGTAGCSGIGNPAAPTIYPVVIDGAQHASGTKSAKVVGGDGCGPLMINTSAFAKLVGGEVYGRFFVHLSDTATTFDHAALMGLGLLADGGVGLNIMAPTSYLQLASEYAGNPPTNVLMWQSDDQHILPNKNAMGGMESTYLSAGFTCIEFHTSASTKALETWVSGALITGLTSPPTPPNATQWVPPSPFAPTSLALGWQVFSGEKLTAWFDDVAVASTRIGCN